MSYSTPKPAGEYAVGTFTYTVADDRPEVMAPGTMRSIATRVYYPVSKSSVEGMTKCRYMTRNMAKGIKNAFKIPVKFDKLEASGENVSECYTDAPKIAGMRFPLILFSHGYNSYREGNSYLCIELASHGFVVISVAHSMEGVCTEFEDGSAVFYDKSITRKTYQPFLGGMIGAMRLTKLRGSNEELSAKFDAFQKKYCGFLIGRLDEWVKDMRAAVQYAKDNLSDLIDFEKGIGVSGHSFGGDTAYALCTEDPDFVCGINIDGALFGDYRDKILTKPFLQVSCEDNEHIVARVYLRHTEPVYKVLFQGMKHLGFSDMKYKIPIASMVGRMEPDVMHANLCEVHLRFFDTFLRDGKKELHLEESGGIRVARFEPDL